MKAIAVNGSPRKNWNTETLLNRALEGTQSKGAETELIHLYDHAYKGCRSCFACKRKQAGSAGICVMKDDLTEILEKVMACDVILLGSPIYLGNITGEMKSFLERLIFPNLSYDSPSRSNFSGEIATGFIYTMGIPPELVEPLGYPAIFEANKNYLQLLNGASAFLVSSDNYQFDDCSKYAASNFDEVHKASVRENQYPVDCQRAFELGASLVAKAQSQGHRANKAVV